MGVAVPRGEGVLVPTAKLLRGEQGRKGLAEKQGTDYPADKERAFRLCARERATWLHFEITNVPLSETDLTKIKMERDIG